MPCCGTAIVWQALVGLGLIPLSYFERDRASRPNRRGILQWCQVAAPSTSKRLSQIQPFKVAMSCLHEDWMVDDHAEELTRGGNPRPLYPWRPTCNGLKMLGRASRQTSSMPRLSHVASRTTLTARKTSWCTASSHMDQSRRVSRCSKKKPSPLQVSAVGRLRRALGMLIPTCFAFFFFVGFSIFLCSSFELLRVFPVLRDRQFFRPVL